MKSITSEPSKNTTVLVVDDREATCLLVSRILSIYGYKTLMAQNGEDALAILKQQPTDVILMDITMPDMNGIEVCRRIKADPNTSSISVILFSAATDMRTFNAGLEAGADGYIQKPFEIDELVRVITR